MLGMSSHSTSNIKAIKNFLEVTRALPGESINGHAYPIIQQDTLFKKHFHLLLQWAAELCKIPCLGSHTPNWNFAAWKMLYHNTALKKKKYKTNIWGLFGFFQLLHKNKFFQKVSENCLFDICVDVKSSKKSPIKEGDKKIE